MTPIDRISTGREDRALLRMEEILRAAADFQPETEATYNFAAAAMARRRFRYRAMVMAVAGCACSALLVWCAVPKADKLPVPIFPPPSGSQAAAFLTRPSHAEPMETSVHALKQVSQAVANRLGLQDMGPRQSPARLVRDDRSDERSEERQEQADVPKAKWETETVDRYATGLLEPTYVVERNPDGSRTYKPAVRTIPLETGERPATGGSSDMGVVSLVNYGGEGTK